MGKVKQMLIDTVHEDQTDPRDTGNYGETTVDEPSEADHAMVELSNVLSTLERLKPMDYYGELDTQSARLAQLVSDMDKPF